MLRTHIWLCIYISTSDALWRKVHKVENSLAILLMILFPVFSICLYLCISVVYAPPPSPLPGATLERDTICLQTPHWAHSGAALTTHFLPCLWHINCSLLYCTMCSALYCTVYCTHVDPHALDWEHPDWRPLVWHEPVKLVPTLITQNICSSKKYFKEISWAASF